MTRRARLHKGRTWCVMLLPWSGFRDMRSGFASRDAAIAWAHQNGFTLEEEPRP